MKKRYLFDADVYDWFFPSWGVPSRRFEDDETLRDIFVYIADHAELIDFEVNDETTPDQIAEQILEALIFKLKEEGIEQGLDAKTRIDELDVKTFYRAIFPVTLSLPQEYNLHFGAWIFIYRASLFDPSNWSRSIKHIFWQLYIASWYPARVIWYYLRDAARSFGHKKYWRSAKIILFFTFVIAGLFFSGEFNGGLALALMAVYWLWGAMTVFRQCPLRPRFSDLRDMRTPYAETLEDVSHFLRVKGFPETIESNVASKSKTEL